LTLLWRRGGRAALAGLVVLALVPVTTAASEPGLLVGITDSHFLTSPGSTMPDVRQLGLGGVHVFLTWRPGQTALTASDAAALNAIVAAASGARLVVTVDGKALDAPTTGDGRAAYCAEVGDLISRYPAITDVVIWNEPNVDYFWQPQYNPDGSPASPVAYEALLAQCYDVLHALRPDVNVIMSTSPGGNNNPAASSNVSFAAGTFIQDLGAAYRQSGRARPLFDTVGHSAYGLSSAESPSQQHLSPNVIGEGDLDHLVQALGNAFRGTAQPVPGDCRGASTCPRIWYLEDGWQTMPDAAHAQAYTGTENDAHPVTDQPVPGDAAAATQASQLVAGIELAYCQPYVGAFFNFLLQDEPDLEGWQSGVLWANGDPKDSFAALRRIAAAVTSRAIDCARLPTSTSPSVGLTGRSALVDRIEWPPLASYSVFNTVWSFALEARTNATYEATITPITRRSTPPRAALTASGTVPAGHPRTLTFPTAAVPAGRYRIRLLLTSTRPPHRRQTLSSPLFTVG
jgi:hypothetical protein